MLATAAARPAPGRCGATAGHGRACAVPRRHRRRQHGLPAERCLDDCLSLACAYAQLVMPAQVRAAELVITVRDGRRATHGTLAPRWEDGMIHGHAVVWLPRPKAPGRRHRRAVPAHRGRGPGTGHRRRHHAPAPGQPGRRHRPRRRDLGRPAAGLHTRADGRNGGHARQPGHGRPGPPARPPRHEPRRPDRAPAGRKAPGPHSSR